MGRIRPAQADEGERIRSAQEDDGREGFTRLRQTKSGHCSCPSAHVGNVEKSLSLFDIFIALRRPCRA